MTSDIGTPKTLREAIKNGHDFVFEGDAAHVEAHVLDFLRQKFAVSYLCADSGLCIDVLRALALELGIAGPALQNPLPPPGSGTV